jgi:hypothetical protein
VKQLLKSVERQIRTLRSVGAGGGQLPPATRWAISDDRPYRHSYPRLGLKGQALGEESARSFEWLRERIFRRKRFCAAETCPTKWMWCNGTELGGVLNQYAYERRKGRGASCDRF